MTIKEVRFGFPQLQLIDARRMIDTITDNDDHSETPYCAHSSAARGTLHLLIAERNDHRTAEAEYCQIHALVGSTRRV